MARYRAVFRCFAGCAGEYPLTQPIYRCPKCDGLLEVAHDIEALRDRSAAAWMKLFEDRWMRTQWPFGSGVWGKREWVAPGMPDHCIVSTGEGGTNIFWADRLGREIGLPDLWLKLCGNSHTGSFKDLGMTVLVSVVRQALEEGALSARVLCCASTGDTSASLAAYGASAGLPVAVLLPRGMVSAAQLVQPLAHGARVFALETDFDGCMAVVKELSRRPAGSGAVLPASYPAANWAIYDQIVRDAHADGIAVDFSLTGPAPLWAAGGGQPSPGGYGEWKPSASAFGQFVEAVATRYSGSYDPTLDVIAHGDANDLPRVSFWELWNEPNFGEDLAPQATKGSSVPAAPQAYRGLLDAGWRGLGLTGHGHDTILIGNLDARGSNGAPRRGQPQGLPGNFGQTKPLQFIRSLYCLDSNYRELRGGAASAVGCPTTAAGSRQFRTAHPALFRASGFADHPYPVNLPPTEASSKDPDFTEFSELPRLASTLDRVVRLYGSRTRFSIYNNEYGYITNPPNHSSSHFVSPATAATYINWAEYLSWKNSRIASTMQYLLWDPNPTVNVPEFGGFASGLVFYGGAPKPGYNAYRLPLFLPATSTRAGRSLEVWGAVRPAHYASLDTHGTPQQVQIQFQPGSSGAFTVLKTITVTSSRGYFDLHLTFPASGTVRLAWSYPPNDPLLTPSLITPGDADTVYSRTVKVTVK